MRPLSFGLLVSLGCASADTPADGALETETGKIEETVEARTATVRLIEPGFYRCEGCPAESNLDGAIVPEGGELVVSLDIDASIGVDFSIRNKNTKAERREHEEIHPGRETVVGDQMGPGTAWATFRR
jgi:hypothetical protein